MQICHKGKVNLKVMNSLDGRKQVIKMLKELFLNLPI